MKPVIWLGNSKADLKAFPAMAMDDIRTIYLATRPEAIHILHCFRKKLDTAVPMSNYAGMTLMWSPVTTAMNKIVKGSATPEVALKEAQAAVTDSIAKLRKGR